MRTRRLHARLAYVMRVDDGSRVMYAAAKPAVPQVPGACRSSIKISFLNYLAEI
jgi:hypothetical protein